MFFPCTKCEKIGMQWSLVSSYAWIMTSKLLWSNVYFSIIWLLYFKAIGCQYVCQIWEIRNTHWKWPTVVLLKLTKYFMTINILIIFSRINWRWICCYHWNMFQEEQVAIHLLEQKHIYWRLRKINVALRGLKLIPFMHILGTICFDKE